MVKLRLRRKGRKAHPIYDIVAMHSKARRDGAFIERLGYYDPHTLPNTISINHEKAIYWLNNGAQPTDVLDLLMSYDGVYLRRHLEFKGKTAEEIELAIDKHKATVKARYARRAQLRIKRKDDKIKVAEQAKLDAEKAAEKAKQDAEKAAEKAKQEAEAAAEKAKQEAEAAAEKAKQEAEAAAEKAKQEAEAAAEKAKQDSEAAAAPEAPTAE